ncbi:unnamed protein product [Linum tenue]|uniref:Uncharacterized protein n=1 Tax=Linum tenue TaxID=586396 RepID=A0AAV0RD89_9ROSI|nr:unnamed protein product [Linum tenue]
MGMMVESSNANYQQCFLKCIKLCGYDLLCTVSCGGNCFFTDPPSTVNNNNLKFCNLGCLTTSLTTHNLSGNHRS